MKIKIEICLGTTCHVMGASELIGLEQLLPPELRNDVEVVGNACLDACHNRRYGSAPFVRINGNRLIDEASIEKVMEVLREEMSQGGNNE
jgi:NADH:ubiquinone oxidoreductase subunit E